jgi:CheY-like chemotaxis protein
MPVDGGGLRVLVCDDSAGFRALIAGWFTGDPAVHVVAEAASARQVLEGLVHRPDVVLLDRLLPDVDAHRDLAAEIKQVLPECVVVLISGMPLEVLADEVAETAADAFASKATSADQLRGIIVQAARRPGCSLDDAAAASP